MEDEESATGKSGIENGDSETKISSYRQSQPRTPTQVSLGPPLSTAQASSGVNAPNSSGGQHVRVQVPLATALQGFIMQEPTGEPMLGPDGQPVLVRLVPVEGGRFAGQMIVAGKLHESVNVSLSSPGCKNGETTCIANGIPSPKSSISQISTNSSKSYSSGNSAQPFTTPVTMQLPKIAEVESRSVRVTWCEPEGCNTTEPTQWTYRLEMAHGRDSKFLFVYNGTDMQHLVENLQAGKEYSFRINAMSSHKGRGNKNVVSPIVVVTTLSDRPGTPPAPRLGNRTRNSLTIKWSAPPCNGSDIIAYHLHWDQGNPYSGFVEEYKGNQRQHKLSKKLESGHCYRFQVFAENKIGQSNASPIAAFCTLAGPPSPPGQPFIVSVTVDSITVGWKEPVDSKGDSLEYKVEMEDPDSGYGFMSVYCGDALQCVCKELKKFTTYNFRVSASNPHGLSKFSAISAFKTLPSEPGTPSVPRLDGRPQPHSIKLIWDPPSDTGGSSVTSYIVQLDDGKGGAFQEGYSGSETSCFISDLQPGRSYRCRVCAASAGGMGQWSKISTVTTRPVVPDSPAPPCLARGQKPKADSMTLHWKPPDFIGGSKITNYIVQMAERGKSGFTDIYSGRDTSLAVNSLQPGRSYRFRIKAKNLVGYGPWSETSLLTSAAAVPDRPDPPVYHCRSPYHILMEWQPPNDNGSRIKHYTLEWIKEKAEPVYTGSDLSCEVKGLKPAAHTYFRLQATNGVGSSHWSEVITVITPPAPPSIVPEVRLLSATHSALLVNWLPPSDNGSPVSHYIVEVIGTEICQVADTQMFITNLKPEMTYRIRVQAVNHVGIGAFSPVLKAMTEAQRLPAPPPPELVQATYNSLKLQWGTAGKNQLIEYCLQMKAPGKTSFQDVISGLLLTHRINRLLPNSPYTFRLAVANKAGRSDWCPEIVYHTNRQPPPVVTGLVCQLNITSVTLKWEAVDFESDDELVYELQCSYPGSESNFRQIYRGKGTHHMIEQLQSETKYRFRVRTCLVNGIEPNSFCPQSLYGSFSKCVEVTTLKEPVVPVLSLQGNTVDGKECSGLQPSSNSETNQVTPLLDPTKTILAIVLVSTLALAMFMGYMMS